MAEMIETMMVAVRKSAVGAGRDGRSARAWYGLTILIATTVFAYVDRQIIYLVAPSLQQQFGWNDLQLGVLQGLGLALFASVAGYPIGWLADRFGRRRVLAGCVIVWSLSTAACAFQNDFAGLFATTAGIAIGEAALTPIIFAMIPDIFPERQRNSANFIFWGAAALGASAGLGLGGLLLDWLASHQQDLPGPIAVMDSWRVALILVAVPAPFFLFLLSTIRLDTRRAGMDEISHASSDRLIPFARMHWRMLACLYGAASAFGLPLMAGFIWLPVALPRIFGMLPSTVGMQMGMVTAFASIAGLVLPALGSRILPQSGASMSLRLAFIFPIVAIVPTLMLPFASTPWQIYLVVGAQFSLGLATGALMPGLLQQVSPPGLRTRLLAIFGVVSALSQGLSPILVGAISDMLDSPRGILTALTLVGLSAWLIAACCFAFARRHFVSAASVVPSPV